MELTIVTENRTKIIFFYHPEPDELELIVIMYVNEKRIYYEDFEIPIPKDKLNTLQTILEKIAQFDKLNKVLQFFDIKIEDNEK